MILEDCFTPCFEDGELKILNVVYYSYTSSDTYKWHSWKFALDSLRDDAKVVRVRAPKTLEALMTLRLED